MRIVHVICSLCTGGAELLLLDILKCQSSLGHEACLIVINNRYEEELCKRIPTGVKEVFINRPEGSRNPWWILKYNLSLRLLRPDVIHFHSDPAAAMTFRPTGIATAVATVHSSGNSLRHSINLDALFAISEAVQNDIKQRYNLDAILALNGIPIDDIQSDKSKTTKSDIFKIVQIGRLESDKKGQDLLISAVARLKQDGYAIQLDIIGEGPSETYLRSIANEYGLNSEVRFLGRRTRDYIYNNLKNYDLLVQPSRFEGFGLTVAEGMAAGVPVIVSDIDGPMGVINRGQFGAYFKNGSIESLTDAIKKAYENYASVLSTAQSTAYEHCRNCFDVRHTAYCYLKSYENLHNHTI